MSLRRWRPNFKFRLKSKLKSKPNFRSYERYTCTELCIVWKPYGEKIKLYWIMDKSRANEVQRENEINKYHSALLCDMFKSWKSI